MSDEAIIEVAFELAVAQLRSQKEDLRNLRSQASIGAAVNGLIAAVFAPLVAPRLAAPIWNESTWSGMTVVGLMIVVAFAGSLVFSILVIVQWKDCTFDFSPRATVKLGQLESRSDTLRIMAEKAEDFFDCNEVVLTEAQRQLWWALVLAWVQIPFWVIVVLQGVIYG